MTPTEKGTVVPLGDQILELPPEVIRRLSEDPRRLSTIAASRVWLRKRGGRLALYVGDVHLSDLEE